MGYSKGMQIANEALKLAGESQDESPVDLFCLRASPYTRPTNPLMRRKQLADPGGTNSLPLNQCLR
jgi:hypothetical protein